MNLNYTKLTAWMSSLALVKERYVLVVMRLIEIIVLLR